MTMARRLFLNLIFAFLILGSAYDIVTDQEHWPFSQYWPIDASHWTPSHGLPWHTPATHTWFDAHCMVHSGSVHVQSLTLQSPVEWIQTLPVGHVLVSQMT